MALSIYVYIIKMVKRCFEAQSLPLFVQKLLHCNNALWSTQSLKIFNSHNYERLILAVFLINGEIGLLVRRRKRCP